MAKDFFIKTGYFGNVVVAFNAIYPTIAETMEPNKIPNRERALMLSPASALKARLAKNIDMVKPIPHKIATAKICLKLMPCGSFAMPSLTER